MGVLLFIWKMERAEFKNRIYLLSGPFHSGKTTFCLKLYLDAQKRKIKISGLLSLPVFEGSQKVATISLNLQRAESMLLASRRGEGIEFPELPSWKFNPEAFFWGNMVLERSVPTELLIIDELGPLEFIYKEGWTYAFQVLLKGGFESAVVVVRPELVPQAQKIWHNSILLDPSQSPDLLLRNLRGN